jgi:hypothetical protein
MMTRKDWTLLAIASAHGEPVSPVQLQKALFLVAENLSPEQRRTTKFYNFTPYDYGPFDGGVYADAELLERDGDIRIAHPPYQHREYLVTPSGLAKAKVLRRELSDDVARYLDGIIRWVRSLTFSDLVRAIYQRYPRMKANSVFRG